MAGRRRKPLFFDHDFPPQISSLTTKRKVPRNMRKVIWKRPKNICRNPRFIVHGATRFDLDQGGVGDCWFIAAAALVATNRELFEWCVPHDQDFDYSYTGEFHFNFWWNGEWVEVVIDDYLPTIRNRLIYAKNREEPNEFWAALLEKAFAKLNGSYEALDGGCLDDALVSLTGGEPQTININRRKIPADLDDILWRSWKRKSLLGCTILEHRNVREYERNNGLIMGHVYSITAMAEVYYQNSYILLCRLRNPWGRHEWNGAWSDGSEEMTNLSRRQRRKLNFVKQDDGEFWISFDDLIHQFDEIELCHLYPDEVNDDPYDFVNSTDEYQGTPTYWY